MTARRPDLGRTQTKTVTLLPPHLRRTGENAHDLKMSKKIGNIGKTEKALLPQHAISVDFAKFVAIAASPSVPTVGKLALSATRLTHSSESTT